MISRNHQFQSVGLFTLTFSTCPSPRAETDAKFNAVSNQIETGKIFMRSKYLCLVLLITMYLTVWFFNIAYASDSIKWHSYEEGKVLAKVEKKKVFLHFYADWCVFCLKMAKETFRDATVVSTLNQDFIAIRVDFDEESAIAEKYGVKGLPSNWFLTQMGQPIVSIPGLIPPEALLSLLKEVNGINVGG